MTDQYLESGLRSWLKDTEAGPDDARRSTDKVMARVDEAGQHGRQWPLPAVGRPALHRGTQARATTATDTTDYRLSSIPRSNGHAPTVIANTTSNQSSRLLPRSSFRFLRGRDGGEGGGLMFSALKLGLATVVVALVGGVLAISVLPQQSPPQVPAAATEEASPEIDLASLPPHAAITGILGVTTQTHAADTEIDPDTGREIGTDWAYAARFLTNDPRLDGEFLNNKNYYLFEGVNGLSGSLKSGVGSLTNEGGSWSVEFHGFSKPGESDYSQNHYVIYLTGEDGYDGLTAMLLCINAGTHWAVDGVIAPGPLPEPPTTVDPTEAG